MIDRGQNLARKIRSADASGDGRDIARANWCDIRLMMHRSLLLAQLQSSRKPPRYPDPMGVLSEAEALLRSSDPHRSEADMALINLYRAEVQLSSAVRVKVLDGLTVDGVAQRFCKTVQAKKFGEARSESTTLVNLARDARDKTPAAANARVQDCLEFLNRAEPVLRRRRRNVWWTTWFFERKLRVIAYSISLSLLLSSPSDDASAGPIPFLGLEAAVRATDTEADRIFNDALRMIRTDAYRLATVVDAYGACVKSLYAALLIRGEDLSIRRHTMLKNLGDGLVWLKDVCARRERQNGVNPSAMDADVERYIKHVQQTTGDMLMLPLYKRDVSFGTADANSSGKPR
jgi:hypothetical protein